MVFIFKFCAEDAVSISPVLLVLSLISVYCGTYTIL
jgi:hypothetical protein